MFVFLAASIQDPDEKDLNSNRHKVSTYLKAEPIGAEIFYLEPEPIKNFIWSRS